VLAGPVGTAWLAAAGYALGGLGRRVLWRLSPALPDERRGPMRLVEGAGRSALAAAAAGGVWAVLAGRADGGDAVSEPALRDALASGAGYGLAFAALVVLAARLRRPHRPLRPLRLTAPLMLDLAGWTVGSLVALVAVSGSGWGVAVGLQWGFALVAAEAARLELLQGTFERRAVDLERVSQASRRMAASGFGMAGLAVQLRAECLRVLEAQYFQLELEEGGNGGAGRAGSWWIGPDGAVHGGAPDPGASPPALPGIHRRRTWRVIERRLEIDGRRLARIRLWCDPRRLEAEQVEILDRLVPQLGAWVHRALLDREAREDPLTGVPVRRLLERALADAFARCRETGGTLSVVMCDLDHFKGINDTFGHAAGDRALKAVAGALEAHRRREDMVARYGGEEFALLLDRTNGAGALEVAERMRRAVERLVVEERGEGLPLTLSLGVASFPELWAAAPGELLALADQALYEAKERGRNRALLNLGQGRFRTPGGEVLGEGEGGGPPEAPRIFA
jgi:diguanylate cyclase (GGDEF)-like protein